jgi:ligand-binding SRPBCC domain-containing protein
MIVPKPLAAVFDFFSTAENLETITPPWLGFRILTAPPISMRAGTIIAYRLSVHGIPIQWLTEIEQWSPPFEFVDVQSKGPYKLWRHTHRFSAVEGGTRIVDLIDYLLPFGPVGRFVDWLQVRRDLEKIFDYRQERVRALLG